MPEADLPVRDVLDQLTTVLLEDRVAVLEAPPGAGKTTLVPLALADALPADAGTIVVLEPRRIAARAAASRMASLRGEKVGQTVGLITREDRKASKATRVLVMTEGVLVRRLQSDPSAEGIGVVVLDEFHERSIEADLALAFTMECREALRDDLAVLVMSATLEGGRVSQLLGGATVVRSEGRVHPVQTRHEAVPVDVDPARAVAQAVREVLSRDEGDVLAFLPGQGEIRRAVAALEGVGAAVMPLYGALPPAEQQRALEPVPGGRRVVVATDIAESSLTVPGVRIVVDAGWSRRPRFDPTTGMSRLDTVRVSQASADQRRGRAAREGPGVCVRLWPANEALAPHAPPTIAEDDLAPVALEIAAWGTPVEDLALLDQPPAATWDTAVDLLHQLGALDADGRLTDHGRRMADLPLHPRLAHMALMAAPAQQRLAAEAAAVLSDRDPLIDAGADLELRIQALRGQRRGRVRRGALKRISRDADRVHRRLGGGDGAPLTDLGPLLVHAYPDRVARRRDRPGGGGAGPQRRGAFLLAGGRGATLPEHDVLAGADLLAVAHVDGGRRDARIFLAAGLDESDVADLAVTVDHVGWRDGAVVAERQRRLGALVLSAAPLADPDPQQLLDALLAGVREEGLQLLPWSKKTTALRDRLRHLHRSRGDDGWPPVDDESLLADLETWLAPFLAGARRAGDLGRVDLREALMTRVPWALHRRLDDLTPTHLQVPSGNRIRIDYTGDRPVLAVKLQEMFGATETPQIAGEPVLLHLLSPAGRPQQVTDDLASFWADAYHQVRADLRGRYPKHPWPEDPRTAVPTAKTKKRLQGG